MKKERQKLVVLGGGESGVGAALLGKKQDWDVFLSEMGSIPEKHKQRLLEEAIDFEEKQHSLELITRADLVVKSPGISDKMPVIQAILKLNIPVISEIEFASRYKGESKLIGITGTNGKSTTTLLTHHLLVSGNRNAGLGGNIGKSFARLLAEENPKEVYVLELSSFQLEGCFRFKPEIAVLLNITPDHLDRYEYDIQKYVAAKFRINANQQKSDWFLFNESCKLVTDFLKAHPTGATAYPVTEAPDRQDDKLLVDGKWFRLTNPALKGPHNRFNAHCAIQVALLMGVEPPAIQQGLNSFVNLPHRMERVGEVKGVLFMNDSKATNVEAAACALKSMQAPVIWIAGGIDKGNNYAELLPLVVEKVKGIICLGKDNTSLLNAFSSLGRPVRETTTAWDAVQEAALLAEGGDVVLLSPACASFDLFRNYEDRGDQFREAVKKLELESGGIPPNH